MPERILQFERDSARRVSITRSLQSPLANRLSRTRAFDIPVKPRAQRS